ncbi:unnamed protein product [Orchesella dallaii]|uniref:Uncharacterized protein n=1 Tax=Orchesella dallaii TaxID=48710 RepID=A0ABP1QYE8_9HEXA
MTPYNILAALLLSFIVKQGQVAQILIEVNEFDMRADKIIAEFQPLKEIPLTATTLREILQVTTKTIDLVKLNEKFVSKVTQPYLPADKLVAPLLNLIQTAVTGDGLKEGEILDLGMEAMRNTNIQKLLKMDVKQLQAEWKELDLLQKIKDCAQELEEIKAGLTYDEMSNEF